MKRKEIVSIGYKYSKGKERQVFKMSSFKVVSKIMKDNEILGYKVHSGFSIFYMTPQLLRDAKVMGLIEKEEEPVEVVDYNTIINSDWVVEGRLNYALRTTTLSMLRNALEGNKPLTKVDIDIVELGKIIKGYRIDASENTFTLTNQQDAFMLQRDFETLHSLIDFFCNLLNKQYVNIVNILDYLKEEKGSTIFTCDIYEKGKKSNEVIEILHN